MPLSKHFRLSTMSPLLLALIYSLSLLQTEAQSDALALAARAPSTQEVAESDSRPVESPAESLPVDHLPAGSPADDSDSGPMPEGYPLKESGGLNGEVVVGVRLALLTPTRDLASIGDPPRSDLASPSSQASLLAMLRSTSERGGAPCDEELPNAPVSSTLGARGPPLRSL